MDPQKQIHIKLPMDLHKEVRIKAATIGITIQDYVVGAIKTRVETDDLEKQDGTRKNNKAKR